ncbi:iron only hydrogenase large subunit-like protein [Natranaerovirga hydrolytica]|uniref:Iron only hydrogenase large subunit-like protein n=1 Tax=Natranaerovirga hydrolytica TaxID=680378 RepID=A0A4R1N248_9FIRM|nr:[Fe-Fe] hydrogenase large subunit C-terminal domain-containing protein [Natranaerovirga hydrolytica]TCK98074.1 iron only hydrogenase large subunit-like protein [Natranaerovirga hydrolytica]
MPSNKEHSVYLDKDKCIGCTDCIKRCPTEAIRVRNKKAVIIDEKCIDCGMCIQVCKSKAKKARADTLDQIHTYKVKVAIPAPTLYTQFKGVHNINQILTALKHIGFDDVIEVAKGAEWITEKTKAYIAQADVKKPIVSSACPVIIKLIRSRFPTLIPNILPFISPKEVSAKMAKTYYINKGYNREDIGVFFISPCAAKITDSRYPETIEHSDVDGSIALKDIYIPMLKALKEVENDYAILRLSSNKGMFWASSGGEVRSTQIMSNVAVDGVEDVIKILEMIEDEEVDNVEYVECLACKGGCLGGPLTVENPYVSRCRMEKIARSHHKDKKTRHIELDVASIPYHWEKDLTAKEVFKLDEDIKEAIVKMEQLEKIYEKLPQIDCGSCGSPTCKALAEDVVLERANILDCIFILRDEVSHLAEEMVELVDKIPRSIQ